MEEKETKSEHTILTRRNFVKLGIGIVAAGLGYYSYELLTTSKSPKKPKKPVNKTVKKIVNETEPAPTEAQSLTPDITAYYSIYLENGLAKALNVKKKSIDFQSSDHFSVIQNCLNGLPARDAKLKVSLKGDFICNNTVEIPSYTIFELDGSITLGNNVNKILIQEANTIIGASQIEMIGGTYDGNKNNQIITNYVMNFTKVTNSHFANIVAQNAGKDCFVLDTDCNNNLMENVTGRMAGLGTVSDGNGLDDRGDHNTWKNCIAEDNYSDNWVIKCRNSTFIGCIGRNSIGSVGFGFFADRDIIGNQFIACQAYGNKTNGMSLNIPAKSDGKLIKIENNSIQGIFYNNQQSGLRLTDVTSDGSCGHNSFDILAYNNGEVGFYIFQERVTNNSGTLVVYNNETYDVYIKGQSNSFEIYAPSENEAKIESKSNNYNTLKVNELSCSESTGSYAVNKYCSSQ